MIATKALAVTSLAWLSAFTSRPVNARCPTSVHVSGVPSITGKLSSLLKDVGLAAESVDGCPSFEVAVARTPGGYQLVQSHEGVVFRSSKVTTLSFAALLIKSWTQDSLEVDAALSDVPVTSSTISGVRSAVAGKIIQASAQARENENENESKNESKNENAHADARAQAHEPTRSFDPPVKARIDNEQGSSHAPSPEFFRSIGANGELGAGTDGSLWFGGAIDGTFSLNFLEPFALWASIRGSTSPPRRVASIRTPVTRTAFEVLLGGELPLRRGPLFITVGTGVGLGWVSSRRASEPTNSLDACGATTTCNLDLSRRVEDNFVRRSISFRAELHLGAGWKLSKNLVLLVDTSATLARLGEGALLVPEYAGDLSSDETEQLALDPEPNAVFRAAVGFAWVLR